MIEDCDIDDSVVADIYYAIFNEDGDVRIIKTEALARKGQTRESPSFWHSVPFPSLAFAPARPLDI